MAVSAARLAIAAAILTAIAFLRRSTDERRPDRRASIVLAAAGCALAVHFATWIASLDYASVAVSTLLVATSPIFTAGWDGFVNHRPLARDTVLAFIAGAIGLVMVVGFDRTPAPHAGLEWFGELLALLGAIAIAAYFLLVRTVRARLGTRTIVTRTYGTAAVALVLVALAARQAPPAPGDAVAWGGILAMAFISQLLGHTAMNASLRWFTPSAVSFATLIEPVFAAALAFAIFHEAVPPLAVAGAAILLGAVLVVAKNEREEVALDL